MSAAPIAPVSGRWVERHVAQGRAMVGVLHLPPAFVVQEGVGYLLEHVGDRLHLYPTPVADRLSPQHMATGVGDLVCAPIWPKTSTPNAWVVRLFEAFPDSNGWVVFGPSAHTLPEALPHTWHELKDGRIARMAQPESFANGLSLGQLLTTLPVWPDGDGVLHTVPQLSKPARRAFLDYHQKVVAADPKTQSAADALIVRLHQDPRLSHVLPHRLELDFCAFLVERAAAGALVEDGPIAAPVAPRPSVPRSRTGR